MIKKMIKEKMIKDLNDIIKYAKLSMQDIQDNNMDNCINSDMHRITGIANDIRKYNEALKNIK